MMGAPSKLGAIIFWRDFGRSHQKCYPDFRGIWTINGVLPNRFALEKLDRDTMGKQDILKNVKRSTTVLGSITLVVGSVVAYDNHEREQGRLEYVKDKRHSMMLSECTTLINCKSIGSLYLDIKGRDECERIAQENIAKRIAERGISLLTRYEYECKGHEN